MKAILAPSGIPARREVRARYEAGLGSSNRTRSSPPVNAQFVYRELTPYIRRRLVDDSRDLVDNSPFMHGLIERMVTYVVGCGIYPLSASKDQEWAAEADAVFAADTESVDAAGTLNWAMMQAQCYRAEKVDGDAGKILFIDDAGAPKVLTVEGHDIGDPLLASGEFEFDGVYLGMNRQPIAYRVRHEDPLGVRRVERVDARWFVHQFDPRRANQPRGIPLLAAALATGRDIHDILALEKAAVKDASSKVDIIKTASGELSAESFLNSGGSTLNGSDGTDPAVYYRETVGPEAMVLRHGDEHTPYEPKRPGPAWQGFMDFLSQTVCISANIPPSVLLQIKVGGADTRRDLAAAARVFELEQNRIARQHSKTRNFFIESRIRDGTLSPAPDDWRSVSWQFPKTITVDAGREAQQDREDVRAGLMSEEEYHGRYGSNWKRHREQINTEARDRVQRAKRLASEESIPFELALSLLGEREPAQIITATATSQQEQTP